MLLNAKGNGELPVVRSDLFGSNELVRDYKLLLRNQSSLNKDIEKSINHLSPKKNDLMSGLAASSSDLRCEKSVPLSRKQSFVYHDSLGTAVEGEPDESSRCGPNQNEITPIEVQDSPKNQTGSKATQDETVIRKSKEF